MCLARLNRSTLFDVHRANKVKWIQVSHQVVAVVDWRQFECKEERTTVRKDEKSKAKKKKKTSFLGELIRPERLLFSTERERKLVSSMRRLPPLASAALLLAALHPAGHLMAFLTRPTVTTLTNPSNFDASSRIESNQIRRPACCCCCC